MLQLRSRRPQLSRLHPDRLVANVKAENESETIVENELYRVQFSNRGAQVTSWILKKYTDEAGKPLDLVNPNAAPKFGYPLSLHTYDQALTKKLSEALYEPSTTGSLAVPGRAQLHLRRGQAQRNQDVQL